MYIQTHKLDHFSFLINAVLVCTLKSVVLIEIFSLVHFHMLVDGCQKCDPNAYCQNNKCVCNTGYAGDGMYCHGKYTLNKYFVYFNKVIVGSII